MTPGTPDRPPAPQDPGDSGDSSWPELWPVVRSEAGPDLAIFRARYDHLRNPRTGAVLRRTVLETPAWVNVVAFTPEHKLLVVRQFRFGPQALTSEIPGGVVDPGEEHGAAARRELLEETGCEAERWTYLGACQPNPAFHDNLCHHWLAEGARRVGALRLDPGEDIRVAELSEKEVRAELQKGTMLHSLVISALSRVMDLRAHGTTTPEVP